MFQCSPSMSASSARGIAGGQRLPLGRMAAGSGSGGSTRAGGFHGRGAPDRIRTCDLRLRRPTLYPLSYRRVRTWSAVVGRRHRTRVETWARPAWLVGPALNLTDRQDIWVMTQACPMPGSPRPVIKKETRHRRRPPPKRGPSVLPDSLIARASFTHGFPHYPNPNLPMALRPVVNRCANSP